MSTPLGKPKRNKKVPISAAKTLAKQYGKQQVIIVTFHEMTGYTVTTYGTDAEKCKQAAQGGDYVKKAIGGTWS